MRPLVLTRILTIGEDEPLYVNPAHIVLFSPGRNDVGAYVALTNGGYSVQETPDQIMALLFAHRSTVRAEEQDRIEVHR